MVFASHMYSIIVFKYCGNNRVEYSKIWQKGFSFLISLSYIDSFFLRLLLQSQEHVFLAGNIPNCNVKNAGSNDMIFLVMF